MALVKVEKIRTISSVRASKVEDRTDADILVFITDLRGVSGRKDTVWTFVEVEGDSNLKIFWDESTPTADLKVCFVDDIAVAGWMKENHPLKGKLV